MKVNTPPIVWTNGIKTASRDRTILDMWEKREITTMELIERLQSNGNIINEKDESKLRNYLRTLGYIRGW